jgi:starvation-inducible DNA-binding protein
VEWVTTPRTASGLAFSTRIDLAERVRAEMVTLLNQELADAFDLYSQVKQAHWNVKTLDFMQLHLFFDNLAENLEDQVDLIAERAGQLGGVAMGSVRAVARRSRLDDYPRDPITGRRHLEELRDRYGQYANSIRAAIATADDAGDPITADLFIQVSRTADKDLWFIESHLEEPKAR